MSEYLHTRTHTHARKHTHTHKHTYKHTHSHTYTPTHQRTYKHTHTHNNTVGPWSGSSVSVTGTSYENEVKLLAAIKDAAEHNGIAVDMLDVRELAQEDADKFDDIATLTGYIRRFANRDLEANTSVFPSSPEKIEELRKKYDTDYVMWVGARSFKGTTFNFGSHLIVNLLFPNYLPYSLLNALEKDHEISYF